MHMIDFQDQLRTWAKECFPEGISLDQPTRNHRFLEEALELVQSLDCTAEEAHQLVDYVFGRPIGEPRQEVGGVMVTPGALCITAGIQLETAAWQELDRVKRPEIIAKIRAKNAAKPQFSALPGAV